LAQALKNCRGAAEAKAVIAAGQRFLENSAILPFYARLLRFCSWAFGGGERGMTWAFELEKDLRLKALDEPDLKRYGIALKYPSPRPIHEWATPRFRDPLT
jgi:hypothetical protein